jgi:hypothetical protein
MRRRAAYQRRWSDCRLLLIYVHDYDRAAECVCVVCNRCIASQICCPRSSPLAYGDESLLFGTYASTLWINDLCTRNELFIFEKLLLNISLNYLSYSPPLTRSAWTPTFSPLFHPRSLDDGTASMDVKA